MISSAELLTNFETCQRWGHWSRSWQRHRMRPMHMFHAAVREALTEDVVDPGKSAGEVFMTLAADRGLDIPKSFNPYETALNHAALADIIVTAIRNNSERWVVPKARWNGWTPSCFMDPAGEHLRRFLAVTYWSPDREHYEKHAWYTLGEMAHFGLPMQIVVAVLGATAGGRRTGYWSRAILHPSRSELRFRLRRRAKVEGFAETWIPVIREEHDEIPREKWLASMAMDEVLLGKSLLVIDVPLPEAGQLHTIRELARRQLGRLGPAASAELPPKQLSSCNNPMKPCPFRPCCWSDPESLPSDGGYDRWQLPQELLAATSIP